VEEVPRKTDFPWRSLCAEFSWKMSKKFRGKQIFRGDHFARNFHGKCLGNSAENVFSMEITLRITSRKIPKKFRGKQIFQGNHCERIFMKNVYKICTAEKKTLHFPPNKLRKIHRGIDYSYLLNFYGLKHVTQIILIAYITKIAILCKIIHPSRLPILVLLLCPHVTARQECLSAEIMNVTSNDVSGKKKTLFV
jgi:hypothetical protein